MTLVLSVQSRDSMWMLVDRRLSYGRARRPTDNAVKVTILEATDGISMLGYAGLGATGRGTQPSAWMSNVLRGRAQLKLEQALGTLADAATRELPRHLMAMPVGAHTILAPAVLQGVGPRLYSIDNLVNRATGQHLYRFTRHHRSADPESPSTRVGLAGTGGQYLARNAEGRVRALLSLVNAHDRGRISELAVADEFARLNYETQLSVRDTVGPRSIVMWRWSKDPQMPNSGGGGHQFYLGLEREQQDADIPIISVGHDIPALGRVLTKRFLERVKSGTFGSPTGDETAELNRLLTQLPDKPDENLR